MTKIALCLALIFSALGFSAPAFAQKPFGSIDKVFFSDWVQFRQQLPDGRKVYQAQVPADDPVIDDKGEKRRLIFAVECRGTESTAALVLQESALVIDSEYTVIEMKGDRDKPQQVTFYPSANKKSLIIRDNATAIKLVQSLYDKTSLEIKAGLTSPATINAEFDINRIETAVEPIAKACGWPSVE